MTRRDGTFPGPGRTAVRPYEIGGGQCLPRFESMPDRCLGGDGRGTGAQDEGVLGDVDLDGVAGAELAEEEGFGEPVLDLVLDDAAQRPGAEDGVEALVAEPLAGS